jgi:hypothetical protein
MKYILFLIVWIVSSAAITTPFVILGIFDIKTFEPSTNFNFFAESCRMFHLLFINWPCTLIMLITLYFSYVVVFKVNYKKLHK